MVAKGEALPLVKGLLHFGLRLVEVHAHKGMSLLFQLVHQHHVFGTHLGLQSVFVVDEGVAEVMVDVGMGAYQMFGHQSVLPDIVVHGVALFGIECATVNDDTFVGIVVDHVTVFLKHVTYKSLDVQHGW